MVGFLNVYKPSGMTSSAVVQKVKKKFNIKKIGHMGTLDPMASGILPLAVGKATRLFDYMQDKVKEYIAIFDFGYTTDTLDITGNKINSCDKIPTQDEIKSILAEFIGDVSQIPPDYSAKNINGMRAYELARKGVQFELKPKVVKIFKIELLRQININSFEFKILCGSGTYIRSIARDIAEKLGTLGCMSALTRTMTGVFDIENSLSLDDILECKSIEEVLINPINVFNNFDKIELDDIMYKIIRHGLSIDNYLVKNNSFLIYKGELIGVSQPNNYLKMETYLFED